MVDLLGGETRVGAEEKGVVHDSIRLRKFSRAAHAIRAIFFQLHESGLSYEVAAKEHAVADLILIEVTNEFRAVEGSAVFESNLKTEPRTIRTTASVVPREAG